LAAVALAAPGVAANCTVTNGASQTVTVPSGGAASATFSVSCDAVHVGDVDGAASTDGPTWSASAAITVHDGAHNPKSGVTVTGTWKAGGEMYSCTTDNNGVCVVQIAGVRKNMSAVTFTVVDAGLAGWPYDAGANHDPDGDSNGTAVTINRR
jgi:hypothetical protein